MTALGPKKINTYERIHIYFNLKYPESQEKMSSYRLICSIIKYIKVR